MFIRDIERLARTLVAQKCEPEYIRYYLIDTYQIDDKTVDHIFDRIGLNKSPSKAKPAIKADPQADRRKRQGF